MAYVPIPRDLAQVKTKVIFNLTKRQLICFGCGVLIGLPLFFFTRAALPDSAAALVMIFSMLPFFLLGMYERNGQPLEKMLQSFIQSRFLRPKKRPYRTQNLYAALARQSQLQKEVERIVNRPRKQKRSQGQADQG